ncbi:MAG TPA: hypothetical protein VHL58_11560 [Thermoanaerobaculia bacterium]|nr:hypothetical protein [Thermoanaerobaculia bacterium]
MTEPSGEESRRARRFIIDPPLHATYGQAELLILDAGETGVQAEHAIALKLGTLARLQIQVPGTPEPLRLDGLVTWSRLSKKPNAQGKYLYRSGIRIEGGSEGIRAAVEKLRDIRRAQPDNFSLQKKEKVRREKEQKLHNPQVKVIRQKATEIPTDQLLLIQQARERLKSQPDEAVKWYNRAKFSLQGTDHMHHREEVLAVWEYLDRTVDVSVIARVFGDKKET